MKNILKIIHKPKHIIAISITIAIIIGTFGFIFINRAPEYQFVKAQSGTIQDTWSLSTSTSALGQNLTLSFLTSGEIESVSVKVGDSVKSGEVLATLDPENTLGALTQAKAAYASAVANYNKLVNGATSADVAVSSSSLQSAQTSLEHSKEILVQTLNDSFVSANNAVSNTDIFFNNPYSITPQLIENNLSFTNQNLQNQIESERKPLNDTISSLKQELVGLNSESDLSTLSNDTESDLLSVANYLDDLNSLFTKYSFVNQNSQTMLNADISNIVGTRASITAQIASLTNATQAVSSAEAGVNQNQASLALKTSSARPEDIASAEAQVSNASGAVQIAQSAYQNRIITSPGNGIVTAVYISAGQIASPNVPAIDLSGETVSKNVSLMIPNNSIIDRAGKFYVLVKSVSGTEEKEITIGSSDATNTEVLSGILAGDEVATH